MGGPPGSTRAGPQGARGDGAHGGYAEPSFFKHFTKKNRAPGAALWGRAAFLQGAVHDGAAENRENEEVRR